VTTNPLPAALPVFAEPPSRQLDPSLPPVPAPPQAPQETASGPQPSGPLETAKRLLSPARQPASQLTPEESSTPADPSSTAPGTGTSTDRKPRAWKPGGDPTEAGETIAGAITILTGILAARLALRGRHLRTPTVRERDEIAMPIGRILVRWLPMNLLGKDLKDATQAAAATQNYLTNGPLISRGAQDVTE
jgi:hypothetical protein